MMCVLSSPCYANAYRSPCISCVSCINMHVFISSDKVGVHDGMSWVEWERA